MDKEATTLPTTEESDTTKESDKIQESDKIKPKVNSLSVFI
jgi:hypothetical protein